MNLFQKYAALVCRDQHREKLRRLLAQYAYDGSEIHGAIDRASPGLELELAATKIKAAIEAKYKDSIPLDAVIEIVAETLNGGELT